MGLRFFKFFIIFILFAQSINANWEGPIEVLSGNWGNNPGEFWIEKGDTIDKFPQNFGVDKNDNLFINDKGNKRIQIFNKNGNLKYLILPPKELKIKFTWPNNIIVHQTGNFVATYQRSNKYFYNYKGNLLNHIMVPGMFFAVKKGYIAPEVEELLYSFSGKKRKGNQNDLRDIKSVKAKKIGKNEFELLIHCSEKIYKLKVNQTIGKNSRDEFNNLYRIEQYVNSIKDQIITYRVYRYDICDDGILLFNILLSEYEQEPADIDNYPTWKPIPIIEYGEPIISPNGDLYCWARTKTHYKILKWTWQGESNTPQSLKAKSTNNTMDLIWDTPTEDQKTVTAYEVSRSTEVCGPYNPIKEVDKNTMTYTDKDIEVGTTYYYQIRAIRDGNYSGYSNKAVEIVE